MDDNDWLAKQFENNRQHLRAVAYRMLGSVSEADDAVQETWIRFSRAGADDVANLGGWLTTIVARISLNMLKSRATRREAPLDEAEDQSHGQLRDQPERRHTDPEQEALMADSVGAAMLVILDTLTPAERLAFVLHDMFALSFEEIAPIVDRSPAATRQLASRARRRVQQARGDGGAGEQSEPDNTDRQREVVRAFLTASREGDFAALLTLLDPDIVLRADADAVVMGTQPELTGPQLVAQRFSGGAQALRLAYIDGLAGLVWAQAGRVQVMFTFTVADDTITGIELIANQAAISSAVISFITAQGTTVRYDKGP